MVRLSVFFGYLMLCIMVFSFIISIFIDISKYELYIKIAVAITGIIAFTCLFLNREKA